MSKSTKIIAGFGVAAALGVAALPLASFATSGDYGTVAVSAVVPDAISMTIDGNAPEEGVAAGNNVAFGNVAQGAFAESDGTTIKNNVTVISSNAAYNFKVQNTSTGANGALASATSTIAPFAEATKPAANQATSGWGFRVTKDGGAISATDYDNATLKDASEAKTYIGVPTTETTLDAVAAPSASTTGTYTMEYGIQVGTSQASGTYNGSIIYKVTN